MRKDEFKRKFMDFGNQLIDDYFACDDSVFSKVVNSTCKYIFKTKINDFDPVINLFADSDGEIDIVDFIDYMQTNMIGDGILLNLKDYAKGTSFESFVPDRTIIIKKDDLNGFLSLRA